VRHTPRIASTRSSTAPPTSFRFSLHPLLLIREEEDERSSTTLAVKTLCIPYDAPPLPEGTPCFISGKPAVCWCLWGRSY
jgi:hypothetical protein